MWPTDENRLAWEGRHERPHAPGVPDAVRERLPDVEGKHVLHLPSGDGEIAAELIGLGGLVTGVDPSEQSLTAARERAPDAAFFQAELDELPLQFRRGRFTLVYAGQGSIARVRDLAAFTAGLAAALRKSGELILHDWHPVAGCIEPVGLRWRDSYFEDGRRRLGEIVTAVAGTDLQLLEVEELPPPVKETGGRLDPRVPLHFLIRAVRTEPAKPASARLGRSRNP